MLREDKSKNDKGTTIKITTFVNHKAKESIIKSENIIAQLQEEKKEGEEQKHEGSEKALSEHEQGEDEQEEMQEEQPSDDGKANVGDHIFLINQKSFACIKNCIEDTLFECDVKGDTQMLILPPIPEQDYSSSENNLWTNKINLKVKCTLAQDKKQTICMKVGTNDKAMVVAEQIADLFAETKYAISFFYGS